MDRTLFAASPRELPFYRGEDRALLEMLPALRFLADRVEEGDPGAVETFSVEEPDREYGFLHEAAIEAKGDTLFASWYNCPERELFGRTPIREERSRDGGRSWSAPAVIADADDPAGRILFCPPVYGEEEGRLYLFLNEMVSPDHIHALSLYRMEEDGKYKKLWRKPVPFKLNTNVFRLPDGKLMLPGRVGELDGFPNTPAVLLADAGRIEGEWRLRKIAPSGDLPDGSKLVHPEISPVIRDGTVYMFCRDDERRVPLVYLSEDMGESWTGPFSHDIPLVNSKIYTGVLSDGRAYLLGNVDLFDRSRLALYLTSPGTMRFEKRLLLRDGGLAAHYPAATETGGRLQVIYTANRGGGRRGAELASVDLARV